MPEQKPEPEPETELRPESEDKPQINRLVTEIVVVAAIFFGVILGLQSLQGGELQPQYNPFGSMFGATRAVK